MGNARGECRIEHVHIYRNIEGPLEYQILGRFPHVGREDLDTESFSLLLLMRIRGPNADLYQPAGEPFLHDPCERTGVREPVSIEFIIEIGMCIQL